MVCVVCNLIQSALITQKGLTQSTKAPQNKSTLVTTCASTQHGLHSQSAGTSTYAAPQPSVVVQAPGPVAIQSPMKSVPANTRCGFCQQQVVTLTRPINGFLTWAVFGGLFLFFIWPCCLIPFFVKSCKDIEHTCPNCKNVIHVYKRM
ncbi:hypothetical protein AMELA_G00234240 [Ameiurus melas]|uniref:LITAF domain-containing protein n=1 Tax=Ameiurus melas TaxID=219545 RepID=A0A7J5ZXR0_AMEME|nr:hypothetical protein AMELA_G00234240 [Ameiurus melas]